VTHFNRDSPVTRRETVNDCKNSILFLHNTSGNIPESFWCQRIDVCIHIDGYTSDIIESVTYSFCRLRGRINFNTKDIEGHVKSPSSLSHIQQPPIFFIHGLVIPPCYAKKTRSPTSFTNSYINDGTEARPKIKYFSATLGCLSDSRSQVPIFFSWGLVLYFQDNTNIRKHEITYTSFALH
jgi:hypothetical protein